jgi:hypothetical protein
MIKRAFAVALLCLSMSSPSETADKVRIAYNSILPPFAEAKDGKAVGLVVDRQGRG